MIAEDHGHGLVENKIYFFQPFSERYQTDLQKETIQLYKEQIDFLKNLVKEKEDMYHVLVKALDKKK